MVEQRWLVRGLYTLVIAGELLLIWDAWSETPDGQRFRAAARRRLVGLAVRAKGCEGCARRKAAMKEAWEARFGGAAESVQLEAEAIVKAEAAQ